MDKVDDRIFTPYISGVVIKAFEESTGLKVTKGQAICLRSYISKWTRICFEENEND